MKHFSRTVGVAALLFVASPATGQVVWNFGTSAPGNAFPSSNSLATLTGSAVSQFNNFGNVTLLSTSSQSNYATASAQYNAVASAQPGASLNTATATAFQVTLTPDAGYAVALTGISFGTRSAGTGPTLFSVRSSADNYATDLLTGSSPNGSWALVSSNSFSSITTTSPITLRIYGYGHATGSSGAANWRVDDLTLTASMTAVPEPSTYAAIAGAASLGAAAWWRRRQKLRPTQ